MTADRCTALRTFPLRFFLFQERFDSVFCNEIQVFYHTHAVFCAIPFIQRFQPLTGVSFALKAESEFSFSKQFAAISHVSAVFAPWYTTCAIHPVKSLTVQVPLLELISRTQTAVHATWSNQVLTHYVFNPLFSSDLKVSRYPRRNIFACCIQIIHSLTYS